MTEDKAIHWVNDLKRFDQLLDDHVDGLHQQDPKEWYHAAREAGFGREKSKVLEVFLKTSREELSDALEKMRAVISGG